VIRGSEHPQHPPGTSRGAEAPPLHRINLSNSRAIFARSPARLTRSRVTYEAYVVRRTSRRPQVDSAQPGPYNAGYAAAKAYVLWLSEAVHAEVAAKGVTVTAVCPGPVPTEFQATNDADYLVNRLPSFTHVPAERVAADALQAAERGRASVVPGGPLVRFALESSRFVPAPVALPVIARHAMPGPPGNG